MTVFLSNQARRTVSELSGTIGWFADAFAELSQLLDEARTGVNHDDILPTRHELIHEFLEHADAEVSNELVIARSAALAGGPHATKAIERLTERINYDRLLKHARQHHGVNEVMVSHASLSDTDAPKLRLVFQHVRGVPPAAAVPPVVIVLWISPGSGGSLKPPSRPVRAPSRPGKK